MPERGVARPSGMSQSSGLPWYRRRTPLIVAFVAIVVALGALQCRAWNGAPNADGISYLELAERYSKGDLGAVANGYWSPLYPALLGLAMRVAGASGIYYGGGLAPELRVALVVNLAVLALATFAFARLALALDDSEPETTPRAVRIARLILAASLWLWAAIRLVAATTVTPDMLLAAWLMLATAELLTLTREATPRATIVRLAIVLALGYWTKAVFFPLVLVGIVAAAARAARRGIGSTLRRRHHAEHRAHADGTRAPHRHGAGFLPVLARSQPLHRTSSDRLLARCAMESPACERALVSGRRGHLRDPVPLCGGGRRGAPARPARAGSRRRAGAHAARAPRTDTPRGPARRRRARRLDDAAGVPRRHAAHGIGAAVLPAAHRRVRGAGDGCGPGARAYVEPGVARASADHAESRRRSRAPWAAPWRPGRRARRSFRPLLGTRGRGANRACPGRPNDADARTR